MPKKKPDMMVGHDPSLRDLWDIVDWVKDSLTGGGS